MSKIDNLSSKNSFFLGVAVAAIVVSLVGIGTMAYFFNNVEKTDNSPSLKTTENENKEKTQSVNIRQIDENDHIRGAKNAKLTIVEYSDLECPYCQKFHGTLIKATEEYPNDLAWVYRHFPLTSLHSKARREAQATECAAEIGGNDGFWSYIDRLFAISPSNNGLDPAQLPQIAVDVGLDAKAFGECLSSDRHLARIDADTQEAIKAGGQGTPFSVLLVDDRQIPVSGALPFEQLKSIIDSL